LNDAYELDCRHISLQGIGSLKNGHFALEIDYEDMPELPSNWSREVSCRVVLVNKQSEKSVGFASAHGDLHASAIEWSCAGHELELALHVTCICTKVDTGNVHKDKALIACWHWLKYHGHLKLIGLRHTAYLHQQKLLLLRPLNAAAAFTCYFLCLCCCHCGCCCLRSSKALHAAASASAAAAAAIPVCCCCWCLCMLLLLHAAANRHAAAFAWNYCFCMLLPAWLLLSTCMLLPSIAGGIRRIMDL